MKERSGARRRPSGASRALPHAAAMAAEMAAAAPPAPAIATMATAPLPEEGVGGRALRQHLSLSTNERAVRAARLGI